MNRRRAFSLLLPGALAACNPATLLNSTVSDSGVSRTSAAYAPGPRGGADIYRPTHAPSGVPLIIFIYGGGWNSGDRALYDFVGTPLARRGAIVVIPDYRLYPEVSFPAFVQDNAAAVAWAVAHAAGWGADPRRVFLMGHSAGAYDALMLALDDRWLRAAGTGRDRLAGVVGLAGPYDFLPIKDPQVRQIFASVNDGPASQPVTFVDGRNPPLLLLAGDADTTVDPRNTTTLADRVRAAGGPVQSRLLPGIGHIGLVTAFAPVFQFRAPVLDEVASFIGLPAT